MPRLLSEKPCELTFDDRISGTKITLHHRMPTPAELIKYRNSQFGRKGGKIVATVGETRQKFGAEILLGFAPGDFATEAGPLDPAADPAWKEKICRLAPDIIEALAIHVFEASVLPAQPEEDADEDPTS